MSQKEERFKSYVAVYLIPIKDGQILLSRRYNTGYQDGNYSLVSGHLEGRETTKQGIIREAREEANIIVSPEDLEVVHVMHRLSPLSPNREYFDIFLKAKKWTGEITNMEPDKCDELKWCELSDLPVNVVPEVKLALENIKNNLFYGEIGWIV